MNPVSGTRLVLQLVVYKWAIRKLSEWNGDKVCSAKSVHGIRTVPPLLARHVSKDAKQAFFHFKGKIPLMNSLPLFYLQILNNNPLRLDAKSNSVTWTLLTGHSQLETNSRLRKMYAASRDNLISISSDGFYVEASVSNWLGYAISFRPSCTLKVDEKLLLKNFNLNSVRQKTHVSSSV